MLPTLSFNMEDQANNSSNNASVGFGTLFDESVILNGVRSRKKNSELPNCPVCSCTIRNGELESHLNLEVDRLTKLSSGSKRKLSQTGVCSIAMPGSSVDSPEDNIEVINGTGSEVFQRVHTNRISRLRARTRRASPSKTIGECPVCDIQLPMSKIQKHALRCLKRTGALVDDDISDTSDDEDIDVENDDAASGGFGAEYQWCGQWRVRASALQESQPQTAVSSRRTSQDIALVVDGDEDVELYGPPQYSPSRIEPGQERLRNERESAGSEAEDRDRERQEAEKMEQSAGEKCNSLVEASAETRINSLKAKIKELESRQNIEAKCLICLSPHVSPAVSIQCWHVYCEVCWLESLRAKKICPQCNAITTTQHLRRIYM